MAIRTASDRYARRADGRVLLLGMVGRYEAGGHAPWWKQQMKSLDLFSCIGCHAIGFERAGIETAAFCEINPFRRLQIRQRFPGIEVNVDIRDFYYEGVRHADVVIGGPPCQRTSVASAIHGHRTGESLWPDMLAIGLASGAEWFVVEQPPGNAAWETEVAKDLSSAGRHVAKFEFGACDVGAPYLRRRVFLVACTSLPRLAIARQSLPHAIAQTKRAANARGDWNTDQLAAIPVDARSAGEFDRGIRSLARRYRIEALGDSNPPHMAEAIGRAIVSAVSDTSQHQTQGE
jgi:site-specific DNA-cytosine methylase